MGNSFGNRSLGTLGGELQVSADGCPESKHGGVTIDWDTVTAVSGSAVTLKDGTEVAVGEKYLRYGQVICLIGVAEIQTVEYTGGPTAGSAVLTLPASGAYPAESTAAIAFNASAAVFQAALEALTRVGAGGASVARSGAGTAGDPYIYTITFARPLGNVPQLTSTHTFTGGTTPTTTHATTTSGGAAAGKYGPYDPSATDGRQTLAKGYAFVLNKTVKESDEQSNHPHAIYGGLVWRSRLLATQLGTGTLAIGPTFTNLDAAFPRLAYAGEHPA